MRAHVRVCREVLMRVSIDEGLHLCEQCVCMCVHVVKSDSLKMSVVLSTPTYPFLCVFVCNGCAKVMQARRGWT